MVGIVAPHHAFVGTELRQGLRLETVAGEPAAVHQPDHVDAGMYAPAIEDIDVTPEFLAGHAVPIAERFFGGRSDLLEVFGALLVCSCRADRPRH